VESVVAPRPDAQRLLGNAAEAGGLLRLLLAPEPSAATRAAPPTAPAQARRVFISYSHEDREFARQLAVSCAQLRRDGWIELWSDAEIVPGTEWRDEIQAALEAAEAIVLLVSPDFIQSDFCYGIEMARALERHASGDAIVLPIIIRSTDLRNAPIEKLQYLPTGAKPVARWPDRDEAWLDVVSGFRRALLALEQRMRRTSYERPNATR
jgi:TIR domain